MKAGQWILAIVLALVALLLLWERLRAKDQQRVAHLSLQEPSPPIPQPIAPMPALPPSTPDDLRRIEGIGPKISAVLVAAGIDTFAALAAQQPTAIKDILAAAGIRLGDPATWPEQAALAAAGRWDELDALQDTLKGGRR